MAVTLQDQMPGHLDLQPPACLGEGYEDATLLQEAGSCKKTVRGGMIVGWLGVVSDVHDS